MAKLPRDEAYIIAFWLETLLFGVHIVVFAIFLKVLRRRTSPKIDVLLLTTAIAMIIIGAINNFVGFQRVLVAFWGNTGQSPADFLNDTCITSNFIEFSSWLLQVILGDAFLAYRCWIIYGKRWWVAGPPAVLIITVLCMGVIDQAQYCDVYPGAANSELTIQLFRWEAVILILTTALNLSLTTAIAAKIWWQYRQIQALIERRRTPHYMRAVRIIVESGLLVALSEVLVLVLMTIGSPGYQIVVHAVNPLIGIAFTGIIVRIQLAREQSVSLDTLVVNIPEFRQSASRVKVKTPSRELNDSSDRPPDK